MKAVSMTNLAIWQTGGPKRQRCALQKPPLASLSSTALLLIIKRERRLEEFLFKDKTFIIFLFLPKVNPINTLGENIADNGAVREAFYAYRSMSKGRKLQMVPKMEEYTPEQLFFISFGHVSSS